MTPQLPPEDLPILDFIYRGSDAQIMLTCTFPTDIPEQGITAGDPYPVDDKECWFTGKHKTKESDAEAEFQKTSMAGNVIARASPDNHIVDVYLEPEDTEDMAKAALLVCDLQVKGAKLWTVWKGYLPVYEDVTRAT